MKINGKEIKLKYTFRALMIYEKITGESFSGKGISEILIYFYSTIIASNKDLTLTFDDFMDWLDDNPTALNNFTEWLTSVTTVNSHIRQNEPTNESDGDSEKNV